MEHGLIKCQDSSDPLYWLRMMLASNRGTLMELGIAPIISSGMVFQLLAGTHLIDVNLDLKSDRELYQTAQKLLAIILSFGQACVYVLTGLYGRPSDLGAGICVLLVVQLLTAALIVIISHSTLAGRRTPWISLAAAAAHAASRPIVAEPEGSQSVPSATVIPASSRYRGSSVVP